MKSNAGMSLIQLIIALGVASVMIVMMAHLSTSTFWAFNHVEKASAVSDTFEEVRSTLLNERSCTLNLRGVSLNLAVPAGGTVNSIRNFDDKGVEVSNVAVTGVDRRGLVLSSLRLRPVAKVDTTLFVANLRMTFRKTGPSQPGQLQNVNGPMEFQRDLPIFARVKNNQVEECWVKKDQGTAETNQVCVTLTNGALDTYDETTKKCTLGNGKWIEGTATTATCPANMIMSPFATEQSNCNGLPPANFNDPFPPTSITMTDGSTQKAMRPFVITHLNGRTCTCDWASDLSGADVAASKCMILCIEP